MIPQRPTSSFVISHKHVTSALCLTVALLTGCAEPDTEDLRQFIAATKAASPGKKLDPLPTIEPYRPFTYGAQGLKDPFALSGFAKDKGIFNPPKPDNGIRPDPERPREELEQFALGSLRMVGTFTGVQETELWALIKAPDGIVHRVREGNYMGADHGEILSITEQRIDLLEIVPDEDRGWKERDAFLSLAE